MKRLVRLAAFCVAVVLAAFVLAMPVSAESIPPLEGPGEAPFLVGHAAMPGVGYWDQTLGDSRVPIEEGKVFDYHDSSVPYSTATITGTYAQSTVWCGIGWSKFQMSTLARIDNQGPLSPSNAYAFGKSNASSGWIEQVTVNGNAEQSGQKGTLHASLEFHGVRSSSNWPTGFTTGDISLGAGVSVQDATSPQNWSYCEFTPANDWRFKDSDGEFTQTVNIDIPFIYGQLTRFCVSPYVDMGAFWGVTWDNFPLGVTWESSSLDMTHTVAWEGISGLDILDSGTGLSSPVDLGSVTIVSASGSDLLSSVTPTMVPEPSSLVLLVVGCGIFWMRRRLKGR